SGRRRFCAPCTPAAEASSACVCAGHVDSPEASFSCSTLLRALACGMRSGSGRSPLSLRRRYMVIRESEVLDYHDGGRPGKLDIVASKPFLTQRDLSLAYTPGVAIPCLRIEKDPLDAFRYTGRGNLVAVVTNGTAVLGLGNIGPLAGKPVMEGKAIRVKRFADGNVFDIGLDATDPDDVIRCVKMLEPTFGGINLEDIRAPECFYIEETLQQQMDIPVF